MMYSYFITVAALLCSLPSSIHAQCAEKDGSISGQCFYVVTEHLNFYEARDHCHANSDNLAIIRTGLDASYIASFVAADVNQPMVDFWIGLSRNTTTSRFTWDDGTPMYWNNFPNTPLGYNYAAENTYTTKWYTFDPQMRMVFVCSYPEYRGTSTTQGPTTEGFQTSTWDPSY